MVIFHSYVKVYQRVSPDLFWVDLEWTWSPGFKQRHLQFMRWSGKSRFLSKATKMMMVVVQVSQKCQREKRKLIIKRKIETFKQTVTNVTLALQLHVQAMILGTFQYNKGVVLHHGWNIPIFVSSCQLYIPSNFHMISARGLYYWISWAVVFRRK